MSSSVLKCATPSIEALGSATAASSTPSVAASAGTCWSRAILPAPTRATRMAVTAIYSRIRKVAPTILFTPPQHQWTETVRDLDQARSHGRMQRLQRMAHGFVLDNPALLHQRLAGDQAALAVFIID